MFLFDCGFLFRNRKIRVCNAAKNAARVSNSNYIIGDVPGNHTAGADHGIGADFDTGKNDAVSTKPNIASHRNGKDAFYFAVALRGMDGMLRRVKSAIWPDKHMATKGDFGIIHKEAVTVSKEVITNL